jgi:hypothetical protein
MTEPRVFSFQAKEVLRITLPSFTVSIVFQDQGRLTVTVLEGENAGFSDTVDYQVTAVRDGVVVLSWQEHIGSTVVHVLDLASSHTHCFVTPAQGGFLRMLGKVHWPVSGPR